MKLLASEILGKLDMVEELLVAIRASADRLSILDKGRKE